MVCKRNRKREGKPKYFSKPHKNSQLGQEAEIDGLSTKFIGFMIEYINQEKKKRKTIVNQWEYPIMHVI